MITLLTPSKTMDFDALPPGYITATTPPFIMQATRLRNRLSGLSSDQIKALMQVSDSLAGSVVSMYRRSVHFQPAAWAYVGDVFKGFQAASLDEGAAEYAQRHLLIPSGLYGLVRPFDMIQPYRLEMKAKLAIEEYKNLYELWGSTLGDYVDRLPELQNELLILSSQEYARVITPYLRPDVRVVTPAFIDTKPDGREAQVAIYNKMMRGVMARWIIDQRIDALRTITDFSAHGYSFSPDRSTVDRPVFYRHHMAPLVFT